MSFFKNQIGVLYGNTVQNEQQNTCRDGDLSRLKNPKLLPVALNPSVLPYMTINNVYIAVLVYMRYTRRGTACRAPTPCDITCTPSE